MEKFEIQHHSTMLADVYRIRKYQEAIESKIALNSVVVDIGSGTGVLSAIAARCTNRHVYAVEYFKPMADFSERVIAQQNIRNVKVICGSSYLVELSEAPTNVITETIGPVGPEENIVEICYQFKKRFPTVMDFIPSEMQLCAVPVYSNRIATLKESLLGPFVSCEFLGSGFKGHQDEILTGVSTIVMAGDLSSAKLMATPVVMAEYKLGSTIKSCFSKEIVVPEGSNGVHLFFSAKLSEKVQLTSFLEDPLTHWRHSYVINPGTKKYLKIDYSAQTRKFAFAWR
jgi:protein arginine N-methyltransferase 1